MFTFTYLDKIIYLMQEYFLPFPRSTDIFVSNFIDSEKKKSAIFNAHELFLLKLAFVHSQKKERTETLVKSEIRYSRLFTLIFSKLRSKYPK